MKLHHLLLLAQHATNSTFQLPDFNVRLFTNIGIALAFAKQNNFIELEISPFSYLLI